MDWSDKNYDDSGWDVIFAPSAWENEGFNGYDGYFANFLAKCIDVLLQGDVLEEGVLEDSLQLLVDLETEFQSHP